MKGITLKEKVTKMTPRESSGNMSSNRFDFQKNWAIKKILELHESPEDYLITFEYFEDIIVFDSSENPKKISFYQVKTRKDSPWTLASLIKPDKKANGTGNSILGKLCSNLIMFNENTESLNFVTNSGLNVKLNNSKKGEDLKDINYSSFDDTEKDKVKAQIKKEYPNINNNDLDDVLCFKLGELSINNPDDEVKGMLGDFIEKNIPGVDYRITPIYTTLFDEIKRKTNFEYQPNSFEQIKKEKSISRDDFEKYLMPIKYKNDFKDNCSKVEYCLMSNRISISRIKAIRSAWEEYALKKMSYNDDSLIEIETKIKEIVYQNIINDLWIDSNKILDKIKESDISILYDDDFLLSIILLEGYGV